ncbi:hypothetical protein BGZ65_005979 [Modicella reniformis]|uniref:Uncharacterized protein n=1 Tax=Modicella reniformis TaxID=1440133 RepID=A0A9P6SPS6_9FUNG|nr:hypothetical protein BGZ65_005979 [Modicella reniformis]
MTPHDSPKTTQRSVSRRREINNIQLPPTPDGELPSLDQYEEMLQKMASPVEPREPRTNLKRVEHDREARAERIARQTRKLQQQQQERQQQQEPDLQLRSEPMPLGSNLSSQVEDPSGLAAHVPVSTKDRKFRRRSSLPSSFGEASNQVLSNLKRRSSVLQRSPSGSLSSQVQAIEGNPTHGSSGNDGQGSHRNSWENENVELREDLILSLDRSQNTNSNAKFLFHTEEEENNSIHTSETEQQKSEQLRNNKRNSGRLSISSTKPFLTTKSYLRLSHTSQSDVQELAMLEVPESDNIDQGGGSSIGDVDARSQTDESDRQTEQFQRNLQQLQEGETNATTPLEMATLEGSSIPSGPPNMQQFLASMDEGGVIPSPYRSATASRSRSTTPISGIRLPSALAPTSAMSAPISPPSFPRKGSPAGRRVKLGMPVSASILPQLMSRPRAGSVASVSSMNNMNSITMDSALQQAHPTQPLPSLPPPPPMTAPLPTVPSTTRGDMTTQRRLKASGSKDLTILAPQLLSESHQGQGQDSLLTPVSLPSMSPEVMEHGSLFSASLGSPGHQPFQITRLKKRVSALEKELETLGKEFSSRIRDESELQFKVEQLTVERDALEKQVALLQGHVFKDDDPDLQFAHQDKDMLMKEWMARQDRSQTETSSSTISTLMNTGEDASPLQSALIDLGRGASETKNEEIQRLRLERDALQEGRSVLNREIETMNARLEQEEAQYRSLQDTVQRQTAKISRFESQHASEVEQLQRDHEEILERVVIEHANALNDLSELQKSRSEDSHYRLREELEEKLQKEWVAKEKAFKSCLEEQSAQNEALEEKLFTQRKVHSVLEEERESWRQTSQSLERQLAIEKLQQQESVYKLEQVEKENRRLRAILADLDLAALLSREEPEVEHESKYLSEEMKVIYEIQRERWMDQIQLLERKVAKTEESAVTILQKNMELMVALDLAQSS